MSDSDPQIKIAQSGSIIFNGLTTPLSFKLIPDYGVDVSFDGNVAKYAFSDTDGDVKFTLSDDVGYVCTVALDSAPQVGTFSLRIEDLQEEYSVELTELDKSLYSADFIEP